MPPNATDIGQDGKEEETPCPSLLSLETTIGGITLSKALLNSSNPSATTLEDLMGFAQSGATGAFSTRTACPGFVHDDAIHQWRSWTSNTTPSTSNEGTTTNNSINCFGYSPEPFSFYIDAVQKVQSSSSKPAILSISGTAEEVRDMIQLAGETFTDKSKILIEINLSCPNFCGKPPIAYDFDGMRDYLQVAVGDAAGSHGLVVGCKTPPYLYAEQFKSAAAVLNAFASSIGFVTCINTVGCGLVIDVETESPVLPATYGGLGGPAVHATALANVHQLRTLLVPEIDIVGIGGVHSGATAFAMLLCGAKAIGVGTAVLQHGVGILDTIEAELRGIMVKKGYTSIADFQGKLKVAQ